MVYHQRLCVHAHFYQPSRKNLVTGLIANEPGAEPFANWNERILEDCYKPNIEIGNFSKISFNIGPTLIEWLRDFHPELLQKIVDADMENCSKFGVGNAIAQPYHHTILPLATRRDKQTQIYWGIEDFVHTFHRKPQGMWLPETAVDQETLEVLAENGIEFTILAPWQAENRLVDLRKAYQVVLPGHRLIKVFFYHSELSSRISFDPSSTINADQFIRDQVKNEFSSGQENQWIMMASDGELYGHHQAFREKFLSYLLNGSLGCHALGFSYPALQLREQKVFPIVKVRDNTSWSCHHGIQRWKGACGCTPNSEWKRPLREALDSLAGLVNHIFYDTTKVYFKDPWRLRDQFIEVISGKACFKPWLESQLTGTISAEVFQSMHQLFSAQVDIQRMFTSCAWFFEDFDRIEPRNNVISAAHATWLVERATRVNLTSEILPRLEKVRSWQTQVTAAQVFQQAIDLFDSTSES